MPVLVRVRTVVAYVVGVLASAAAGATTVAIMAPVTAAAATRPALVRADGKRRM
ncbi:MAG: hypothetical protein QOI76_3862, partial [Frankiales bacterium]|nr:hypothetical protein [Frankiales bacterium]